MPVLRVISKIGDMLALVLFGLTLVASIETHVWSYVCYGLIMVVFISAGTLRLWSTTEEAMYKARHGLEIAKPAPTLSISDNVR